MNEDNGQPNQRRKPGPKPKIDRGRTGSDLSPAMEGTEKGLVSRSREETAHSSGRPARISMSNMKKLQVPDSVLEEGFYYRFFQDKEGRLSQAQAAGYTFVADDQGNNYVRASGPYSMHLMRLPQEYRDEDLALKRQRVAVTMDLEAQIGHNEYAPDSKGRAEGGTSAITHQKNIA